MPLRPATLSLALCGLILLGQGCTRAASSTAAPERSEATTTAASTPRVTGPELDGARLRADIEHLASDALRGRWTLSPELAVAAEYIAGRHRELGLQPVGGSSFLVDFPITVGVTPAQPPTLEVVRDTKVTALAAGEFQISPQTGSGDVRGPAVFVGYAAQSEQVPPAEGDAPGTAAPSYDDLAGLDLKGKIAVVLLDAPGRPDPMALFGRLRDEQTAFSGAAAPLKASKDSAGLVELHKRTLKRLLALISPYARGADLKDMWPLPADPLTLELDLQSLAGVVMREAAKLKGPKFGFAEGSLKQKVERLARAGAVGVVAVRGPRSFFSAEEREADAFPPLKEDDGGPMGDALALPIVHMKWKAADKLLRVGKSRQKISALQAAIDEKLAPRSGEISGVELRLAAAVTPIQVQAPNIVAAVPGTDLAQELVVLGAHYDHIGVAGRGECVESRREGEADAICNGADDNASGTAMLLELARHFSAHRPRRTVVFVHFAGEELGLLGSKALAERPPFPLDKVAAMVNLDMIGRLGPKGLAIGGLVSSDAWLPLLDRVGTAGVETLYEASVATRSDHAHFYRKNVPVLFFFTFTHADYHRPSDSSEKINHEGLLKIGTIIGGVAQALADGYAVPFKPPPEGGGLAMGLPGTNPATVVKRVPAKE